MTGLVFEQVCVELRRRRILDGVSLEVRPGELVTLLGPNGAGKTTLLRAALGLLRPSSGRVLLSGREAHRLSPRERAAEIAWLPQQSTTIEALRALEVVIAARYRFAEPRASGESAARHALARVGAEHLAAQRVTELSGGERQRVALATLLAQEARIVLLDEPANHLDPAQQLETHRFIGELWGSGLGVLLVSHDVNLPAVVDAARGGHVVGLASGRVAFVERAGAPELPRRLSELYGVDFHVIDASGRSVLVPVPSSSPNPAPGKSP